MVGTRCILFMLSALVSANAISVTQVALGYSFHVESDPPYRTVRFNGI